LAQTSDASMPEARTSSRINRPLIVLLPCFMTGILLSVRLLPRSPACPVVLLILSSLTAAAVMAARGLKRQIAASLLFLLAGALLAGRPPAPSKLRTLAQDKSKVVLEGTVLQPPRITKGVIKAAVLAQRVLKGGKWIGANEKILVTVYENGRDLSPGRKLRFPVTLRPFRNFNNPGGYDYRFAMERKGFTCAGSVSDGRSMVLMGGGALPFPQDLLEKIRAPARSLFSEDLAGEKGALYRALILGERQALGTGLRDVFNRTGLAHILAVSGLHVGLLAWCFYTLLRWILLRVPTVGLHADIRKLAVALTFLPVTVYACVAGLQLPTQRALIMVAVFLGSVLAGKEREVWSTLALAGLLILAMDPLQIFSISFQLSFAAVAGILWLAPPLIEKLSALLGLSPESSSAGTKIVRYFLGLLAAGIAATVFLAPILAYHFHRVCPVGILANLVVVPVLGLWVIPLGFLAVLFLPLSHGIAFWLALAGSRGLEIILKTADLLACVPFGSFWMIMPSLFEILLFYLFLYFTVSFRSRPRARSGLAAVCLIVLVHGAFHVHETYFKKRLRVTFLDVGQANAALVEFPGGRTMLIDCGGFPRDHFDTGRMVVAPFLWHSKILRLDYLVLSHPQADHMNGLRFIAETFHPGEFWHNGVEVDRPVFRELMAILKAHGVKIKGPRELSNEREISGVRVQVLHPRPEGYPRWRPGRDLNNHSLVLRLSYGNKRILFPGDLEWKGERQLIMEAGRNLRTDVLLAPHHGSRNACSKALLARVRPRLCVISCGKGNRFGFPHQETIRRLREARCAVLRTDRSGAVQVTVDASGWKVRTYIRQGTSPWAS